MTGYALPQLPYDYGDLQPWIDERTMRVHHDCHHQASVDALNGVEIQLEAARVAQRNPDVLLVRYLQQLVNMYAADHILHSLFFENMGPNQGGRPRDELADQIAQDFGSFATFKSEFCAAATSLDNGGWTILVWQPGRERLAIVAAEAQRLQAAWVGPALLVLDMCEHAYYLKYQNRRIEYAHNWWNTVHWSCVARRFGTATHPGVSSAESRAAQPKPKRRDRHALPTPHDRVAHARPFAGSQ
jgi:Fe-Mn family superoxide dismutase